MPQKLTVHAERGRPDNLREPVKIAFTIGPIKSEETTPKYTPHARWVTSFPVNVEKSVLLEWGWELTFNTYADSLSRYGRQHRGWTGAQGSPCLVPGQSVTIMGSPAWSDITLSGDPAITRVINRSGSAQKLLLCGSVQTAMGGYDSIEDGDCIKVPSGLELQAYAVEDEIAEWTTLWPEDLSRPIFAQALNCNDLPASSTWRLCRDPTGEIRLKNEDHGAVIFADLTQSMANSVSELKDQFDGMKSSLYDAQGRLEVIEAPATRSNDNLPTTQLPQATTQSQPLLERPSATSQGGVALVQESLPFLRGQFGSLSRHLMLLEARTDKLEQAWVESTLQTLVSAVESKAQRLEISLSQTRDKVSVMQGSQASTGDHLLGLVQRVVAVEAKTERLEELWRTREAGDGPFTSFDDSPVTFPSGV